MNEFDVLYDLLKNNSKNYSGYKELGDWYLRSNVNQAFLCYEQALFFCDSIEEKAELEKYMLSCKDSADFQVHPASFVILSYNSKDMMIECLESIRNGCAPGSYEIVVVDNYSQDGIREYLKEQNDIILQLNDHNTSFAAGCNQGAKLANSQNDIFMLNNDTVVPPLALFYMRLALYASDDIGAVGPTSNAVIIAQHAPGNFSTKDQWLESAKNIHLPSENAIENKIWLVGFALLIKRKVWDLTGNFDERFVRGCFEDTDFGFRLVQTGYRNVLCHNAFIFHYGSVSMKKDMAAYNKALWDNEQRLNQKLGIEFNRYMSCHDMMVGLLEDLCEEGLSVLEVGCGFGLTLSKVKYVKPDATVVGIESNAKVARIGSNISNIICANVEKDALPFEKKTFDYILLSNIINYFEDAEKAIRILKTYLKDEGKVILLTPNPMNAAAFVEMLKGKFESIESITDEKRHFYTKDETIRLLSEAGLRPRSQLNMVTEYMDSHPKEKELLESIKSLDGVTIGDDFRIQSYVFTATVK